jgi:hypothetical protein
MEHGPVQKASSFWVYVHIEGSLHDLYEKGYASF